MSILSNKNIESFLQNLEEGKLSSYKQLDPELARTTLARFGTDTAFFEALNKYFYHNSLEGLNELFLFGTHGIMFTQQNKELVTNFLNKIKDSGESDSILEYIMSDIHTVTNKKVCLDDLAQAWIAPVNTNPVELDPDNPSDHALIAMSQWVRRTCVLWTFYAYRYYTKYGELLEKQSKAIQEIKDATA